MPWLLDCPPADGQSVYPNLSTFAHICKVRYIQSQFMHNLRLVELGEGTGVLSELQERTLRELHEWEKPDEIYTHRSVISCHEYTSTYTLDQPKYFEYGRNYIT